MFFFVCRCVCMYSFVDNWNDLHRDQSPKATSTGAVEPSWTWIIHDHTVPPQGWMCSPFVEGNVLFLPWFALQTMSRIIMQMLQFQHWPRSITPNIRKSQDQAKFQDDRVSGVLCSPSDSGSWFCPMMCLILTPSFFLGSDWSGRKKVQQVWTGCKPMDPKASPTSTALAQGKNTLRGKT